MKAVGDGEMVDNQAQPELLPPTFSCLHQRLPLQEGNSGYTPPLYLSAVPNTGSGTTTGPLLYQWPPKIYGPWETSQPKQPMTLPSLPKTNPGTPSELEQVSRKVVTDKDRDRMRAYADEHPLATQQKIAGM